MKPNHVDTTDRFRPAAELSGKLVLSLGLLAGAASANASTDYAPAHWVSAPSGYWYTSGNGHHFAVIHDMEGYYLSTISYLSQPNSRQVSVYYCVNGKQDTSTDRAPGDITQMVREAYYAWHARCWNQWMFGTEHEGFASNPAWYTEGMYSASSALQSHLCAKTSIPKDRNHVIGHNEWKNSHWQSWMGSNYPSINADCNTHSDPGAYWNWAHFMDLINGVTSTPSAPSGLTATVISSSQINLAWTDNSSIETGYKIERSPDNSSFTQIATVGASVTTYSSTGLSPATTYYYRVRAYNASGNSGYSNTASGKTKDIAPNAPSSLTATATSSSQINLGWADNSSNETGFKVERSTDNVTFTQVATPGANAVSYSDTGLNGNTTYYYRVRAYNSIGNSAYSNTASDITAPQAPSGLTATAVGYNEIDLSWIDNSSSEVGFKIERSPDNVTFTQIATNAAGVTTFADTGRSANTIYYYRVRSYNANGNSTYSNTATATTPIQPPVLSSIGNKTVNAGSQLTFTATSTDPNHSVVTTTWQDFESFTNNTPNESVMFNKPANSSTTTAFIDTTATNFTRVTTSFPTGHSSAKVMMAGWTFKTGTSNPWCRLNTFNPPNVPNPCIDGAQCLRFDICATKSFKIGVAMRETGTSAAYGANGGTTGTIDWAGVTNVISGAPIPNRQLTANAWTTLTYNIPFEPQAVFTGDGAVATAKGALEHVAISANGNTGSCSVYMDNFAVVSSNTLTFSLDAGFPSGASINSKTGVFKWTPTTGQGGNWNITVRVTDQLGATDFETIKVTVITGNSPPVLSAIGNKTINEGSLLSFTASATDPDAGQTLTFSLDSGYPTGASINSSSGAFTWTPTESQGPGAYPITVRVTDNGTPSSNDWETITVTVNEVNVAPVLATIADQTVNELSTLTVTPTPATDADLPANTLTYSLDPGFPSGMTINSSSGVVSWTPTEAQGPGVYPITVRVTDNGTPSLYAKQTFNVTVNEVNIAPVLTINTTVTTITNFADFEVFSDGTYNGTVMFHQPSYSGSTSSYLDTSNNLSSVEGTFPSGNLSTRAVHTLFTFKSSATNPWLRLSTYNASTLPNPTIDLTQRLRFDVYADKAVKIALGIRETQTSANIGANGGTSGTLEWVGSTGALGTGPNPNHTVSAGAWTTIEFNIPAEPISTFTGNGILDGAKGVLEHLAIVPAGGMGPYNVYFDNFQVVTITTNLAVDTLETIYVTNSATDADLPAQNLTFSLDAGAPTNAVIDPATGLFSWTPSAAQSPSTNVISVRVTDDGPGALSNAKNMTIIVHKVNTAPRLSGVPDQAIETTSGDTVTFTAIGEDDDVPADTLTFSLQGTPPTGATINSVTGDFSWTPPSGSVSTNIITVRVTDNGTPPLYDEQDVTIVVIPTNVPPTIALGAATVTETIVTYETMTDMANEHVMFNKAGNSSTTSSFIDTAQTQSSYMTNSFPSGNPNGDGSKIMKFVWSFKTGTSNPWVRMNTLLTGTPVYIKNPAIELQQTLQFDIYTTKSLKVGVGVRETGTAAAVGADGGTTGSIEWVGVTNVVSGSPQPSRVVNASNWTTLTFNFTTDSVKGFTGNGVLASGRGVLEHLAFVPNGGMGAYTVYVDNFKQIYTSSLTNPVTMNAGATLAFTASATNPDAYPGEPLNFTLDADAPTNAAIDLVTGAFSWTPGTSFNATTNPITVSVQDSPTNGAIAKTASQDISVIVNADPLGPQ